MVSPEDFLDNSFWLAHVQSRYPHLKPKQIIHRHSGINHTYIVTTDTDSFSLRVYHPQWRTRPQIAGELEILNVLAEKNISVSRPIADAQGTYIHEVVFKDIRCYVVLFSYAPGNKIKHQPAEQHYRNGKLMAEMHQAIQEPQPNRFRYDNISFIEQAKKQIDIFVAPDSEDGLLIRDIVLLLVDKLSSPFPEQLPKGFLHMDMWPDNMHIDASGKTTLFDFDFCGWGYLSMDIAYYLLQLRFIESHEEIYETSCNSFISGYTIIRPVSNFEMKSLNQFSLALLIFYLGVQCERYDDWSKNFLNEEYLHSFIHQRMLPIFQQISQ